MMRKPYKEKCHLASVVGAILTTDFICCEYNSTVNNLNNVIFINFFALNLDDYSILLNKSLILYGLDRVFLEYAL